MTMMDDRIVKDLMELYNDGATPGDIQDALHLDGLVQADDGQTSFATRALPGYYCGDRKAKTVMVMLNPGCDVETANRELMDDLKNRSMKNAAHYKNYKPLKAIIANTFPHQALPNAYRLMEMYGKFCYKEYTKK